MTDSEVAALQRRLKAAEAVCLLYGWSAGPPDGSPRSAATLQAWMEWHDIAGDEFVDSMRAVFTDEEIERLAAIRADVERRTHERISALIGN